jgi:thiaminase/transcriptional activator TenA
VSFAQDIERKALPLRQVVLSHPFITGVGDGTLPVEKFKHYVTQDYVYLIDYARAIALASARAPDLQTMGWFARLLDQTLNTEMNLHRSYCAAFGITKQELEATQPAPTTVAYTSFLLKTAYQSSFAELVACLLPCLWGYWEIGDHLAKQGEPKHAPLYCQWIQMYASLENANLARDIRSLADGLAEVAGSGGLDAMDNAYLTSMRWELKFWDMAYNLEHWQV